MQSAGAGEITQLLSRLSTGDQEAEERLVALIYKDLRQLTGHYLATERGDHALQATAIVHEAYLRIKKETGFQWQNRSHFFALPEQSSVIGMLHAHGSPES